MPCVLSPFIASLAIISAADPIIPIPTGSPIDPGPFIGWTLSPDGVHWRAGYLEDDCERHAIRGRVEEWSIESHSEEFSRTSISRLKNSLLPERILRKDWYLLNSFSYGLELTASVRRPGAKATFFWYPVEGVQFSIGLDLLRQCPFGGLQLFF